MATRSIRLLLLDANVVLELHRLNLWSVVVERCEVLLARTVLDESKYFERDDGNQNRIDLGQEIETGQVRIVEVPIDTVIAFQGRFRPAFLERLDPDELESLAYLAEVDRACIISSADKIVWRTLGDKQKRRQSTLPRKWGRWQVPRQLVEPVEWPRRERRL